MLKWSAAAAAALCIGLGTGPARAQEEIEMIFAIPAQTLTFSAHFVAHDGGFFKKEGLKVTDRNLVGVASPNAVLAGSADLTVGTGPVFLRAASKGQKFKAIDGYTTSMPFTGISVMKGNAIMVASSTFDAPELVPFAYAMVYGMPDFCTRKREVCERVARAYQGAAKMIQEKPDEVFEKILKPRFAKQDPELLRASWKIAQQAHAKDVRVSVAMLENSQKVSLVGKLLDPKDALTSFDDLFTDEFVK